MRVWARLRDAPRERLADLVSAASYGCVLVLAALGVIGIWQIKLGYSAELVLGVGVATWIAHLFAELLGNHVLRQDPLHRSEVARAVIDGSPILLVTILPASALLLGRLDLLDDGAARLIAIAVGTVQLLAVGAVVGRVAPSRPGARWLFAAATAGAGLAVVLLTVLLGH